MGSGGTKNVQLQGNKGEVNLGYKRGKRWASRNGQKRNCDRDAL